MVIYKEGGMIGKLPGLLDVLYYQGTGSYMHEEIERMFPGKVERVCILPGCEEVTSHGGGYCCAEHCVTHRRNQKRKRELNI